METPSSTPASGPVQFAMRPKAVQRYGSLVLPILGVVAAVADPSDPRSWLLLVTTPVVVLVAWRERLVVQDDTLFLFIVRRGHFVLLDDLTEFAIERHVSRIAVPYRSLHVRDSAGRDISIDLWEWDRWRELITVIETISGRPPRTVRWLEGAGEPPFPRPRTPGV